MTIASLDRSSQSGRDGPQTPTDIAAVLGEGSTATAGGPGDSDIAAVFGDMLHAVASGGNSLVDILPSL